MLFAFLQDESEAEMSAHPHPVATGTNEGENTQTTYTIYSTYGSPTSSAPKQWYWHNAFNPYLAYDPETDSDITIEDEYKSDWYSAKDFCKIHKYLIWSIGIVNGDVTILPTNKIWRTVSAENALADYFGGNVVDGGLIFRC